MKTIRYDKFGSFFRLNEGVLEYQPQSIDPTLNNPNEEDWIEVDWTLGVEPEHMTEMKEIEKRCMASPRMKYWGLLTAIALTCFSIYMTYITTH